MARNARAASRTIVVRVPANGQPVQAARLLAAAAVFACASSPTYAASPANNAWAAQGRAPVVLAARDEDAPVSTANALNEIRLRTAMTWDQIGDMFAVTRRTIHSWATGSKIKPVHQEKVVQAFDFVRKLVGQPTFVVRRNLLAYFGQPEPAVTGGLPVTAAILASETSAFEDRIPVGKPRKTKIVRA